MMKVSLILEAVNRATGPIRAVTAAVDRMGAAYTATAAKVTAGAGRIATASRMVGSRIMAMNDTVVDATHHFRRMVGEEGMARASRSMTYLRNQVSGLSTGFSILKYATVGAGIGLAEEFVRGVYTAGGESQRMLVTLTRLEGGAIRARQAMSWMQTFAMGPGSSFSMPDIMRSYQMAKNFGMNPQGGSLAAFADLAAGERVPLKQILIAVKDAMEGTSTRPISNLGIKMKQGKGADGENSYLYSNLQGKFVTEHSAKTPEAVLATLVRIINSKYMGLATAQAKTVPGGFEQIRKLLYLFEMKVADAGVINWTLKQMNRFFAWVRKASADGSLDRLAKQIATFVTTSGDKLIAFLQKTDWAAVARDLKAFGAGLLVIAGAIKMLGALGGGGLNGLLNVWIVSKIIGLAMAFRGLWPVIRVGFTVLRVLGGILPWIGRGLLAIFVGMDPIAWVILAVGVAIWALWGKWGKIGAWIAHVWNAIPGAVRSAWGGLKGFFQGLWASISSWTPPSWMMWLARLNPITAPMALAADLLHGAVAKPAAARPTGRPIPGHDPYAGTRTTNVGGTMTIEFKNAPPHKVTRMESVNPNFLLSLNRGPIKAGD